MQPIHNLILIVLLTAVFTTIAAYAFVRLRRLQRRLDAHEEAERLANLPSDDEPQHRRHMWLVPAIGAVAGAAAWTRSHPAASGAVLAATAAAVAAALIGPSVSRQHDMVHPSVAAPTRGLFPSPSSVIPTSSAPPAPGGVAPEPSQDQPAGATSLPATSETRPPLGVPATTSTSTSTSPNPPVTTTPPSSTSTSSAPAKPPDTPPPLPSCLIDLNVRPLLDLCLL